MEDPTMVTIDLTADIIIVDFVPVQLVTDEGEIYYMLSIVCVQDTPHIINDILTNIFTDTLEEMALKINAILNTGMFDGLAIALETELIVVPGDNVHLNWKDYGVVV